MRRQNKKALYESIMRDVAKVVKRRLNESDEETNIPKKITKLSEIPFEYLLNPELNEDFVKRYPKFFKLKDNGKIGMCVYDVNDFDNIEIKYHYTHFENKSRFDFMSPILTFYEDNVATLLAKAEYINHIKDNDDFGLFITKCTPFVELFSSKNSIPNKFDKFLDAYKREIEKYKSSIWFSKLSKSSHRNLDKKTIIDFFGNFVKIHISSEIL